MVNYTKRIGITVTLMLTVGSATEYLMSMCTEHTTDKQQEFNYFNTTKPVDEEKDVPIFDTFMVAFVLLCNVCELVCFIVIFFNMFRSEECWNAILQIYIRSHT